MLPVALSRKIRTCFGMKAVYDGKPLCVKKEANKCSEDEWGINTDSRERGTDRGMRPASTAMYFLVVTLIARLFPATY